MEPQTQQNPDVVPAENTFETTDLPEEEKLRRSLAAKRTFFLVLAFIAIAAGLLVWEIIELASGGVIV